MTQCFKRYELNKSVYLFAFHFHGEHQTIQITRWELLVYLHGVNEFCHQLIYDFLLLSMGARRNFCKRGKSHLSLLSSFPFSSLRSHFLHCSPLPSPSLFFALCPPLHAPLNSAIGARAPLTLPAGTDGFVIVICCMSARYKRQTDWL